MTPSRAIAIGIALFLLGHPLRADDTPVKSKIVGVDLFKNGLAVVKREVTLGKPGTYVIDDVPQPVHGTYWIKSAGTVDTLVQMRDVDVPANETAPGNLQEDLAGKRVTVFFRGDKRAPVVGTMMKFKREKRESPEEANLASRYLTIQTARGRTYIDATEVASVESDEAGDTVKRRRPRLVLTLGETEKAETKVFISYLAHGLSWAASYKIDISDPKMLSLEQHAIIKNELSDLDGAEVRLISGYPSIQFSHVRSLLAPGTTLAAFFQELNGSIARMADIVENSVVSNQAVAYNFRRGGGFNVAMGAIPMGEGVDLHYQPIGKRSLKDGDTLAITVGKGKSDYERIVEWLIPDTRNEFGAHDGRGRSEDDDPWDALKFKNPLSFPMTTAPALVTANGEFNGQRTSYWVNPGEETVLRVNKALSIRTRSVENEQIVKETASREFIWVGGRQYRKSTVEAEIAVSNHRKETVQMVIRRRFSGELISAEGSPKSSLREEGVFSINKRYEMVWDLPLKSGEEKKFKYSYTVMVPH